MVDPWIYWKLWKNLKNKSQMPVFGKPMRTKENDWIEIAVPQIANKLINKIAIVIYETWQNNLWVCCTWADQVLVV